MRNGKFEKFVLTAVNAVLLILLLMLLYISIRNIEARQNFYRVVIGLLFLGLCFNFYLYNRRLKWIWIKNLIN